MKFIYYAFILTTLVLVDLRAQDLSQQQVREDFDYLLGALEEGHPGLYWYSTREEFAATVNRVETALATVKDIAGLQSLLTAINNTIACGHTAILLPESYYQQTDSVNRFLPFNIALVEDQVVVAESFTNKLSRGDQILRVNEIAIDTIIRQLARFIPIDKGITTKRDRSLELIFPYYYALYLGNPDTFTITYINHETNQRQRAEVPAIGYHDKMYKSVRDFAPARVPLRWSVEQEGKAGVLTLATFSGRAFKQHGISFQDTIRSIFTYLHKNGINKLVIDLRWNNGGTMPLAEYLFAHFIDSTYRYYDDARIKQAVAEGVTRYTRSRNMKPMLEKRFGKLEPKGGIYLLPGDKNMLVPATPRFTGTLYVLTNGFSFSATSSFISHIQQHNLGIIVGETPGGAFNGVNAGPQLQVTLPNSKIRLYYRAIGTRYNVDVNKTKTTVDVPVRTTRQAFMNSRDLVYAYVLKALGQQSH